MNVAQVQENVEHDMVTMKSLHEPERVAYPAPRELMRIAKLYGVRTV